MSALDALAPATRARLRRVPPPEWIAPMLATLTDQPFSDSAWFFERKLDGERCLAYRHGGGVRLTSRTRRPLDATYPEVADALAEQPAGDWVLDGEVVALKGRSTSFALLQQRMGIADRARALRSAVPVVYYVFDVVHLDGWDTRGLAARDRKALVRAMVRSADPVRYTAHRNTAGEALFADACAKGWEGLVAKRADSAYVSRRSTAWRKLKCSASQEVVVGGFTEPGGSRVGLGALLVGTYDDGGHLHYAGKVGTGFSNTVLLGLRAQLDDLEIGRSPFAGPVPERHARWVRPAIVAQVAFSEWTTDGRLRHPRFEGVRDDKEPHEVRRERPRPQP